MPEIADVVPGQDVLAEWGNQVRDRVVSRYTTQAALETAEPGAPNGSVRWTDDNGLLLREGGAWVPVQAGGTLEAITGIYDTAGVLRLSVNAGGDNALRDDAGVIGFLYDQSFNAWRFVDGRPVIVDSGADLEVDGGFIRMTTTLGKLKLGPLADPDIWSGVPMAVIDNGSLILGTMGSFDGDIAFGWTRASTGYVRFRQGGSTRPDAQGLKFSVDGTEILYESNWGVTATPAVRFRVNDGGPTLMVEDDSVAALAADVQNLVSVYGQLEPAVVATTPEEDDRPAYQSLPIREILADLLARVEALEAS